MSKHYITQDSEARKRQPIAAGVLDYFPAAIAAVAEHSFIGNEKHNPGQALHWSRGKSMDHADCIARHLIERGTFEEIELNGKTYRVRHSAALAWRALALLQEELEAEGLAPGRAARFAGVDPGSPEGDVVGFSMMWDGAHVLSQRALDEAATELVRSKPHYIKWLREACWPTGVYVLKHGGMQDAYDVVTGVGSEVSAFVIAERQSFTRACDIAAKAKTEPFKD